MKKLESQELDFYDFRDVAGQWRSISQAPLQAREELLVRLNRLNERLQNFPAQYSFAEAWESDGYLRFLCLRCCSLGGIKPEWLKTQDSFDLTLISNFLFPRKDGEGKTERGILVRINFPTPQGETKGNPQTYEEIIAAIWSFTENLSEALELAKSYPGRDLTKIVEARAEIEKKAAIKANPELAKKEMQKHYQDKARADRERMQQQARENYGTTD